MRDAKSDYMAVRNARARKLHELWQYVYDININPDPHVLTDAVLNLRHALLQVIHDLEDNC